MATYQFVIFIAIFQSVLFLGHWVLYKTLVYFFGLSGTFAASSLKIILIILSISFIIINFFAARYSNEITRFFYFLTTSWLGFLNFLFWASIIIWVAYFLFLKFSLPFDGKLVTASFFSIVVLMGIYGLINAANPQVKNIAVKLPNLPDYWNGKKAVWVSDIHLGNIRRYNFAKNVADKIKKQNPDIVFIGGDFFDGGTLDLDEFAEPFSKINPTNGIYFITGNHEEFFDDAAFLDAIKKAGIRILSDEMVNVSGLQIIGVDWKNTSNSKGFENVLNRINIDKNLPSILLKHAPDGLKITENKGISFQISGHTHVGQIYPWRLVTKLVFKNYDYGLNNFGNLQVYTSNGVGTWGPAMRVGNTPEIVAIKLERK